MVVMDSSNEAAPRVGIARVERFGIGTRSVLLPAGEIHIHPLRMNGIRPISLVCAPPRVSVTCVAGSTYPSLKHVVTWLRTVPVDVDAAEHLRRLREGRRGKGSACDSAREKDGETTTSNHVRFPIFVS